MFKFVLLLILLLTAFAASSQPTNVCLTTRQAAKIADSLAVLPLVRAEAAAWAQAAACFRTAADSLAQADRAHYRAYLHLRTAYVAQTVLLTTARLNTDRWRGAARKRGLLNWLAAAAVGGAGYLFLFR